MSKDILEIMDKMSLPDRRQQRVAILELEEKMLEQEQTEIPPNHLIHGGMYARAVTVPAGTLLTGHIYKYDHIEVMASGILAVTTDDGSSRILQGFNLMPALTGKKRAAYAIEDTTWITFHAVGNTGDSEPEDVQEMLTCDSFEDLEQFYADVSKADYLHFIAGQGWTEEDVRAVVEHEDDLDFSLDLADYSLELKPSVIEGQGLYTAEPKQPGDLIMPARLGDKRTQAGRFINHAVRPNSQFVIDGDDMNCIAITKISAGEEITVNYRETLEWRSEEGDLCQE